MAGALLTSNRETDTLQNSPTGHSIEYVKMLLIFFVFECFNFPPKANISVANGAVNPLTDSGKCLFKIFISDL